MLASAKFTVLLNFNLGLWQRELQIIWEPNEMHIPVFPVAAVTSQHKLGGLKEQKLRAHFMLSMVLRMKGSGEVI